MGGILGKLGLDGEKAGAAAGVAAVETLLPVIRPLIQTITENGIHVEGTVKGLDFVLTIRPGKPA